MAKKRKPFCAIRVVESTWAYAYNDQSRYYIECIRYSHGRPSATPKIDSLRHAKDYIAVLRECNFVRHDARITFMSDDGDECPIETDADWVIVLLKHSERHNAS
jgi:hypothetical protein